MKWIWIAIVVLFLVIQFGFKKEHEFLFDSTKHIESVRVYRDFPYDSGSESFEFSIDFDARETKSLVEAFRNRKVRNCEGRQSIPCLYSTTFENGFKHKGLAYLMREGPDRYILSMDVWMDGPDNSYDDYSEKVVLDFLELRNLEVLRNEFEQ